MPTKTDAAADLCNRMAAIEGDVLELQAERDQEVAFAAHVEKDAKAVKRLAEINARISHLESEGMSLKAAMVEVGRRDAAAQAATRDGKERANAERALKLLHSFSQRGLALDAIFERAVTEYQALQAEFSELDRLGFSPTTPALVSLNMRTALKTKVMNSGLQVEYLAPGARRSFVAVIESWAQAVRARATTRLNKSAAAA